MFTFLGRATGEKKQNQRLPEPVLTNNKKIVYPLRHNLSEMHANCLYNAHYIHSLKKINSEQLFF